MDSVSSSNTPNTENIYGILNDIQHSNRFKVQLTRTNDNKIIFSSSESIRVKSFNIPNTVNQMIERNTSGIRTLLSKSKVNDTFSITFYDTEKTLLRKKFDDWMNICMNKETGKSGYYSDYIMDSVFLYIYSYDINKIQTLKFNEVYPTQIGDITFDRSLKDSIISFNVTFTFKKFYYL